jgi:hypothetical protein
MKNNINQVERTILRCETKEHSVNEAQTTDRCRMAAGDQPISKYP